MNPKVSIHPIWKVSMISKPDRKDFKYKYPPEGSPQEGIKNASILINSSHYRMLKGVISKHTGIINFLDLDQFTILPFEYSKQT